MAPLWFNANVAPLRLPNVKNEKIVFNAKEFFNEEGTFYYTVIGIDIASYSNEVNIRLRQLRLDEIKFEVDTRQRVLAFWFRGCRMHQIMYALDGVEGLYDLSKINGGHRTVVQ